MGGVRGVIRLRVGVNPLLMLIYERIMYSRATCCSSDKMGAQQRRRRRRLTWSNERANMQHKHWNRHYTLTHCRCLGVCACVLSYLPYARVPLKRLIISACCSSGSPGRKSQWDVHVTQCKAAGMGHGPRQANCLSLQAAPVWVCVCVCSYSAVEQSTFHLQCAAGIRQQAEGSVRSGWGQEAAQWRSS